MIKIGLFNLFI